MKIGVSLDSASGWTKDEAEKLGYGFVPLIIEVHNKDGKNEVLESGTLSDEDVIKLLESSLKATTSSPPGELFLKCWEKMLKTYDHVFHIPISKAISATQDAANLIVKESNLQSKVTVVDSLMIAPEIRHIASLIRDLISKKKSVEDIQKAVEAEKTYCEGSMVAGSIKRIKASGRISGFAATLAGIMKIHPVIPFEYGKFISEKSKKIRTHSKAIETSIEDLYNKAKDKLNDVTFFAMHTFGTETQINDIGAKLKERFNKKFLWIPCPNAFSVNSGVGTFAFGYFQKEADKK